jgi:Caspase domain
MSWLIRLFLASFCVATLGSMAARDARAETRVALVVGNAKYEHADVLANTVNDAMAVSSVLKKAGFDVDERDNLTVVEFKRAVRDFARTAANADIAVVYYSGHGVEFAGTNYLIPTDARLANDSDVEDEAIPLDRVLAATHAAKKLSLIILDACRENPFLHLDGGMATKRVSFKGLVPLESTGTNTLVAYAAKAGSVSFDGSGANSPFTTALVKYIAEPGLDIRMALGKVRDEVLATTGNAQEPSIYGSLGGTNIFLVPASLKTGPLDGQDADHVAASDYEMAERLGSRQAWQVFLAAHNSGYYVSLARIHLARLQPVEAKPPPIETKLPPIEATKPTIAAPETPNKAGTASAGRPLPSAQQPTGVSASAPERACKSDAAKLAALRLNPSPDQVAKFSSALTCEDLRPQVERFMESLGMEISADVKTAALEAPTKSVSDIVQICTRESEVLSRLRANPIRENAVRFARDLKCEDLKAQVARLLESISD